ncbi:hypothetical protein LOTGIDRAFT_156276 [Lottia gigantea]|uniref:Uncharacterized protein n=1 Tax=Lottia gigantea TaxID=225164 RepID=V4BBQ2_LOTGI|nr:hypothetical protein LOTGIDRAFT_156276 [Lottia gigantea]ESP05021.1 hypothetical protein LOTGIDRAFT_156276 [Lottia gigantea]
MLKSPKVSEIDTNLLLSPKHGSLTDLTKEEDDVFEGDLKANLGLLRRAFSSMKRRRRRKSSSDTTTSLRTNKHEPLRAVKSSPPPLSTYAYFSCLIKGTPSLSIRPIMP